MTAPREGSGRAPGSATESEETRDAAPDLLASLLDNKAFVGPKAGIAPPGGCLLGLCTDDRHPSLLGRVRVQWQTLDGVSDAWLPVLRHVSVRRGDQLLLSQPLNGAEAVVVGVVDGFAHRAAPPDTVAAKLELKDDEVVRIDDAKGRPLLELRAASEGPVVKLLQANLAVEVEGKLSFKAESIRMEAKRGKVEIEATDDVCVKGEVIHLN